MQFECCDRCENGEENWQIIDIERLLKEVSNDLIDMMIWYKATVRVGGLKYRRHIPETVIDWSKKETIPTLS